MQSAKYLISIVFSLYDTDMFVVFKISLKIQKNPMHSFIAEKMTSFQIEMIWTIFFVIQKQAN